MLGEPWIGVLNMEIVVHRKGFTKKNKPPNDGVEKIGDVTVDLTVAMVGIVKGIRRLQNQYVPETSS